jgi:nucleotide-binding universal stress UspA family protein
MNLLSRILVATDFSPAGRVAVTRAAQLASQHNAKLHIVHATPDWKLFSRWTTARPEHYDAVTERAEKSMNAELAWVAAQFGVGATHQIGTGRASTVITDAARDYCPSLIVAGARGEHQPRISPESFGGTTLKLLLHTDYPLLLVRGWDQKPYRISLAAIHDCCDLSKRLVLWATSLVGNGHCHVMLAYEAPYIERIRACMDVLSTHACELASETVAQQIVREIAAAAAHSAHVHPHAVKGKPLPALVTEIATHQPTLVVLGRQEFVPGVTREPFGTDGFRMAYHCPVDTLVVP